jgi:hypothetical protein
MKRGVEYVEVNVRLKNDLQYVTWPHVPIVISGLDSWSILSPTLLDNWVLPVISKVTPRSNMDPTHCLLSKDRNTVCKNTQNLVFCTFEAPDEIGPALRDLLRPYIYRVFHDLWTLLQEVIP